MKLREVRVLFQDLKKYDAHLVVRVCEPTYNADLLEKQGIDVLVSEIDSLLFLFLAQY